MYYKKNRNVINSIKNNKNNKVYYALIVIMLAAIGTIAACIILSNEGILHNNNSGIINPSTEESTYPSDVQSAESQGASQGIDGDEQPTALYRTSQSLFLFLDDKLLALCETDETGEYAVVKRAALGAFGNDIYDILSGMDEKCISSQYSSSSKALWKSIQYNNMEYYVQYNSQINDIDFHSALYTTDGDNDSIVPDSYRSIGRGSEGIDDCMVTNGVTLTVLGSKWVYENVPGNTDVYICSNIDESSVSEAAKVQLQDNDFLQSVLVESQYIVDGYLIGVPAGFYTDPTDYTAGKYYSQYKLGKIQNISDKTIEMGQIAYSFLEKKSTLPGIFFADVQLLADDGTDISQYLAIEADISGFTTEQLAAMNRNGFLIPGDYPVNIIAADRMGNVLSESAYIHVIDSTPPAIQLSREIIEINQAQIENPDYIRGMVTVTDLCELSSEGITYTLEEKDRIVTIVYTVADVYGNVGIFQVELTKVD